MFQASFDEYKLSNDEALEKINVGRAEEAEKIQNELAKSFVSSSRAVQSVAVYIDRIGALALFSMKRRVSKANAKTAVMTIMRALPFEQQRTIEKTLHPMNELDKERVEAFEPVTSCKPKGFTGPSKSIRISVSQAIKNIQTRPSTCFLVSRKNLGGMLELRHSASSITSVKKSKS